MTEWTRRELIEFLKESECASYTVDEAKLANKYFTFKKWDNIELFIKVDWDLVSLWTHSTIDVTDAHNFIIYCRVLANNLLRNEW